MEVKNKIGVIKVTILLLSFILNPGAIIIGVALYGISLDKAPFEFLASGPYTNHAFLFVGLMLLAVNLLLVLHLDRKKKALIVALKGSKA